MWTPTTRRQHSRANLRYETDLTDAEWAVIAPLIPTAGYADTFAQSRAAMDVMVPGAAIRKFHASQHASTIAS